MRKIYIIGAFTCLFAACKPSVNITTPVSKGSADFTNYLAIGDNYTAGFADNSLTVDDQLNSFPVRLWEQFKLAGGSQNFYQPLLTSDYGFPGPKKILAMTYNPCNPADSSLGPIDYPNFTEASTDLTPYVSPGPNGQINNIATYGLRAIDFDLGSYASLAAAQGAPYAQRFYLNPTVSTPKDELGNAVHNLHPTFFTMWLGTVDILGYAALGGGQGDGTQHALPVAGNLYNQTDISNIRAFEANYDSALNVAISTGAGGALINIPDVSLLPFFHTIPVNGLTLTRQGQVDSLQALYPGISPTVVFQVGANNFIITDHNGNVRQAAPGELILLTTPLDSLKCAGWGATTPIPAKYVLTTDEIQFVQAAADSFNSFIFQEAKLHNLAYVDMNSYFKSLSAGFAYNGINYSAQFVSGGAYSLDGIHFTQRGYALIANQIITTINAFYHSTLPPTNANQYHGIDFP